MLNIWNCNILCAADIQYYGLSVDIYQLNPVVSLGHHNRSVLYVVQDESHNQECQMEISNVSDHQQ